MNNYYNKTYAIISYLWWIGFLIAYFKNQNERNPLTSFHIRQSLGLLLIQTGVSVIFKYTGPFVSILFLAIFVLWLMGLISAIKGERKLIPFIGESFQEWFKNLY